MVIATLMICLGAQFIVETTDEILKPNNKDSKLYVSLAFIHLYLCTMVFSISPKINEGFLHQELESHMTHIGNNISTKDE